MILYTDSSVNSSPDLASDEMLMYYASSYLLYIRGDDEGMDALDADFMSKLEEWRDKVKESLKAKEETGNEQDAELAGLKIGPKGVLEQENEVRTTGCGARLRGDRGCEKWLGR